MTNPQVTLKVSRLYAFRGRGRKSKRVYPSMATRAVRKNAECMASLDAGDRESLHRAAEALKLSPLVRSATVSPLNPRDNGFELVVYSRCGLVTNRDQLDFVRLVRYQLTQELKAEVAVTRLSL
jgi:hypothetical protein